MPELRWALLGLGALFIAGLALWEWRRNRRRLAQAASEAVVPVVVTQPSGDDWSRRIEPRLDSLFQAHDAAVSGVHPTIGEVPVIHPLEPIEVPVAREAAVDLPAAAVVHATAAAAPVTAPAAVAATASPGSRPGPVAICWPPERADRVISLRLTNAQGALLGGREVRLALEQAGLVPGPQTIYHRVDAKGGVLASAANMMRPGDLDPRLLDEQQLRGLSLFSVLPGPLPPVRMLEELVALARSVAWRLGALVQDEHGAELDGERLVQIRQSLPDAAASGAR
jgi:FtsZ-interacting cell division protein ZipA